MSLRRDLALLLSPDLRSTADQLQHALTHIQEVERLVDPSTLRGAEVEAHLFAARTSVMFAYLGLTGRMPKDTPWSPDGA